MRKTFSLQLIKKLVESAVGPNSFIENNDLLGGLVVREDKILAMIERSQTEGTLIVSFRASAQPNVVACLAGQLTRFYYLDLDPSFEFGVGGELVYGTKAIRFFAENAKMILLNEKDPEGSLRIRPKGHYVRHKLN